MIISFLTNVIVKSIKFVSGKIGRHCGWNKYSLPDFTDLFDSDSSVSNVMLKMIGKMALTVINRGQTYICDHFNCEKILTKNEL